MKQHIIIRLDDGNVEEVATSLPVESVHTIDSDTEGADEGYGDEVHTIDGQEYCVTEPSYQQDAEFVEKVLKEYEGKDIKKGSVEIYLLVTDVKVDKKTCLYGDILAVFWDMDEAIATAEKIKRGEPVDFIDVEGLFEYDELAVIPFSIR